MRGKGHAEETNRAEDPSAKSARPGARRPRELLSQAPAPRAEIRKKPAPGPRKHISALRGEVPEQAGGRTRTLRSETADRSGRTVPVERLVAARPASARKDTRRDRDEAAAREPQRAPLRGRAQAARGTRARTADARPRPGRFRGGAPARASAAHRRNPKNPESSRRSHARPKASREARRGASGAKEPGESRREGPRGARAQKPRGPYDAVQAGRGRSCGAVRTPDPKQVRRALPLVQSAPGRGAEGPKRYGAGPGKPGGPKSAGRSFAAKGERASGPASGFRGKDKAPGGKGRPGGESRAAGRAAGRAGKPGGAASGAPRGAPRGGPGGGPGKGRPRGKT